MDGEKCRDQARTQPILVVTILVSLPLKGIPNIENTLGTEKGSE